MSVEGVVRNDAVCVRVLLTCLALCKASAKAAGLSWLLLPAAALSLAAGSAGKSLMLHSVTAVNRLLRRTPSYTNNHQGTTGLRGLRTIALSLFEKGSQTRAFRF